MDWFSKSYEAFEFHMFSASHITVWVILAATVLLTFLYRSRFTEVTSRRVEVSLAFILILLEASYHGWMLRTGTWSVSHALPLELCSLSVFLTVALLLTRQKVLYDILLFIGVLGASQALITPYLYFDFPHFRFFHFFGTHSIIFWTPLYFTWIRGYRPTLSSVIRTMLFLNLLVPPVLLINKLTNGNYLYLAHKPETASLLDLLGPYPWYIVSLEGVAFLLSLGIWLLFKEKEPSIFTNREYRRP